MQRLPDGFAGDAEAHRQFPFRRKGVALDQSLQKVLERGADRMGLAHADVSLPQYPFRDGKHVVDCRSSTARARLGILGTVVVASQAQCVRPPGVRDECGVDPGAALIVQ